MLVKNCMTPNPITVTPEEDTKATFDLLKKHRFRQVPVVKDGKLVGIVTDGDLRVAFAQSSPTVGHIMSSNPVTISEDAAVEKAAQIIRNRKFNALPVVSKTGKLVGIITITDIIDGLLKLLNFHAEPTRVEVKIPEGASLADVVKVFQASSEKVLSFSSPKGRRNTFYFWVVDCDFDKLNRNLRRRSLDVTVNYPRGL